LVEKINGQAQPERGGSSTGEQECPDRVGAIGQRPNLPSRLHPGSRSCRNVIQAVE